MSGTALLAAFFASPATSSFAHPLAGDPLSDNHLAATTRFHATWPTEGMITTYFGELGPASPRGHSGLEIAAPRGTEVVAADDGEVLKAYWDTNGYGGLIIIAHPSGYETWYAHLDRLLVEKGDRVARGQEIGLMGSTGLSSGSHLHLEIREDGHLLDPLRFLSEDSLKPADS